MKYKINTAFYCLLLIAFPIFSCKKEDDSKKEWGIALVFMPQAAILNGGADNNYPVPLYNNASTDNFILDSVTNTLTIPLSVYRSGLQSLDGYSVKAEEYIDTTNQIIAGGTILDAVLLPMDVYTLPATVSVPDGKRESNFTLSIDRKRLVAEYPEYYFNNIVLVIGISNPTKYELNPLLSKTTIIIDGKSFMPHP